MDLSDLVAIEEIKQLKARYFRLMDAKAWNEWRELFAPECSLHWGPGADDRCIGAQAIVDFVSSRVGRAAGMTVHHGHMPEIEVLDQNHARGTWALFDYLDVAPDQGEAPFGHRHGYARYFEEYRRDPSDERWRFASIRLTFTRMDLYRSPNALSAGDGRRDPA